MLDGLLSYGTTGLERERFEQALDGIAADVSAGTGFSLQVLADQELRPALPEAAFATVRQQQVRATAGRLQSPDYRAGRAFYTSLLPAGDPVLRETTPQIPLRPHPGGRARLAPAGVPPGHDHDRGDRRGDPGGGAPGGGEALRRLDRRRPEAAHPPCRPPRRTGRRRSWCRMRARCRTRSPWGRPCASPARSRTTTRWSWATTCWAARSTPPASTARGARSRGWSTRWSPRWRSAARAASTRSPTPAIRPTRRRCAPSRCATCGSCRTRR